MVPLIYGHLPHSTKNIQVRRTRHAEHCWRSKDDVLLWIPTRPPTFHLKNRPPTFHLKNTPSNTKKTCRTLLEMQWWTKKWRSSMDLYTWICHCWQARIYISWVQTQDVVWKTCREWWMTRTDVERESGKSVLSSRLDDDDDDRSNNNDFHIIVWLLVLL